MEVRTIRIVRFPDLLSVQRSANFPTPFSCITLIPLKQVKSHLKNFLAAFSLGERLDWETQRKLGGFQRKSGYLQGLRVLFRIHSSTRSAEEWVGGMIAAAYDVFCRTLAICLIAFGHRKMEHDFGGQILSDKLCHLLEAQDYEELRLKFEIA